MLVLNSHDANYFTTIAPWFSLFTLKSGFVGLYLGNIYLCGLYHSFPVVLPLYQNTT